MNIQWQSMTGFGAMAWNHGGPPLVVPATRHHHEQKQGEGPSLNQENRILATAHFPHSMRDRVLSPLDEDGGGRGLFVIMEYLAPTTLHTQHQKSACISR